jgi:hypothetical protein
MRIRFRKKLLLFFLAVILALPALWVLQIEFTYERNVHRGIPADFHVHPQHTVVMWKV